MMQNIGFKGLYVRREDNEYLNNLIQSADDKDALKKACARIDAASGDDDVYLKTTPIANDLGYCMLSVEDEDGSTIHQEICNSKVRDVGEQLGNLAKRFITKFNPDTGAVKSKSGETGSGNTIDDIFDTYA